MKMGVRSLTYKEWEDALAAGLRGASRNDVSGILNYYKEIYGDKRDAGVSDEEIIAEFGTPDECIERIRSESPEMFGGIGDKWSIAFSYLKRIALAIFILIPLCVTLAAGFLTLVLCMLGGAAVSLGGIAVGVTCVANIFSGVAVTTVFAQFGIGMAMVGGGAMISIGFFFMIRYVVISAQKILKYYIEKKNGGRK